MLQSPLCLEEIPVYYISYTSQDDGYRLVGEYFLNRNDAETDLKRYDSVYRPAVLQKTLWQDQNTKKIYELTAKEVMVDQSVHKKSGLAKLTEQEKAALGLI